MSLHHKHGSISKVRAALVLVGLLTGPLSYAQNARSLSAMLDSHSASVNGAIGSAQCSTTLDRLSQQLRDYSVGLDGTPAQQAIATDLLQRSFAHRLAILDTLKKISKTNGQVTGTCEKSIRRYLNTRRIFEEYVATNSSLDDSPDVLQGKSPQLLINPKHPNFALKSGDILVSRGTAVVSAAIAKVGDQEGIYSHAAMVYIDPTTKKTYIMQSEIETGTEVDLIDGAYMHDGKVRANVLRYPNEKVAADAAAWMYKLITDASKRGTYYRYNFDMDLNREDLLFCSQLPYLAFEKVTQHKLLLADQYKTTFVDRKNRSFLDDLQIKVATTISPNDFELDAKLELVAEWRDYSRIGKTHRRDAVMDSMFNWMEKDGYVLNRVYNSVEATVVSVARSLPGTSKLLKNAVAENIKNDQLKFFMTMSKVGSAILESYVELEGAQYPDGYVPSYSQMMSLVEQAKVIDLQKVEQEKFNRKNFEKTAPQYTSKFMKFLTR